MESAFPECPFPARAIHRIRIDRRLSSRHSPLETDGCGEIIVLARMFYDSLAIIAGALRFTRIQGMEK
jgi:hypothetical protein